MQDKPQDKAQLATPNVALHPLKALSKAEFAALGAKSVVFQREISAEDLETLIPNTPIPSEATMFYLVVSADGSPVLVTDTFDAVEDWLDDSDADLALVH